MHEGLNTEDNRDLALTMDRPQAHRLVDVDGWIMARDRRARMSSVLLVAAEAS